MRRLLACLLVAAGCGGESESPTHVDAPIAPAVDAGVGGVPDGAVAATPDGATAATLTIDPTSYGFGTVLVGDQPSKRFVVTRAGGPSATLSVSLSGSSAFQASPFSTCDGATLGDGDTCTVEIVFAPTQTGAAQGVLHVDGNLEGPGMHLTAQLDGEGASVGVLTAAPPELGFDDTQVNATTEAKIVTVTNSGQTETGTITVAVTGSEAASFAISADGCTGKSLAGATSCQFGVAFHPAVASQLDASVAVSASPGGTATVAVSGRGLAPAHLGTDASHTFGPIRVGESESFGFTVTNDGDVATGMLGVTASGDTVAFTQTNDCPKNLVGGASCTVTVTYAPKSSGTTHMTLEVAATPGGKVVLGSDGTATDDATLTVPPQKGVTVTSNPDGIKCGAMCVATYPTGTKVRLVAAPAPGTTVTGWESGACPQESCVQATILPCTQVTLTQSCTVMPLLRATLDVQMMGPGTMVSTPSGIRCAASAASGCTAEFAVSSTVELDVLPQEAGASFTNAKWTGCDESKENSCVLLMPAGGTTVTYECTPAPCPAMDTGCGVIQDCRSR